MKIKVWMYVVILVISPLLIILLPVAKNSIDSIVAESESAAVSENTASLGSYFVVVEEWWEDGKNYSIVYAADTKVMYLVVDGSYRFGITELYNDDGTVRIYE